MVSRATVYQSVVLQTKTSGGYENLIIDDTRVQIVPTTLNETRTRQSTPMTAYTLLADRSHSIRK